MYHLAAECDSDPYPDSGDPVPAAKPHCHYHYNYHYHYHCGCYQHDVTELREEVSQPVPPDSQGELDLKKASTTTVNICIQLDFLNNGYGYIICFGHMTS